MLVTSDRGIGTPAFSSDGQRLVFVSPGDIVGANADLDPEVFVVDVSSGSVAQVTSGTGNNAVPVVAISGNGTRVAFPDERPLSGPNREGNSELRRAGDIVTTALASLTVQHVLDTATGTIDITDLTGRRGTVEWEQRLVQVRFGTERYVFSLSTKDLPAPGTYRIRVSLDDHSVYTVDFSLR